MSNYFNNGRITIRASLYLSSFIISIMMGFSAPVTTVYFLRHVSPELVSTLAIVLKLCMVFNSYIRQSKVAVQWITDHFIQMVLVCEVVYFILAIIGEMHPEIRYVGYNLIGCVVVKLLLTARQSNIVNCLKGNSIITFNAACDTWGLVGSLLGSALCATLLVFGDINITACMLLEFAGCTVGHILQAYANNRIQKELLKKQELYTLVDVLNDLVRVKRKKDEIRKSSDEDDSIFDQ